MKKYLCCVFIFSCIVAQAQTDSLAAIKDIEAFQGELNAEYKDPHKSPLYRTSEFTRFKSHDFYPIDLSYRVTAKLEVTNGTPFFQMKTTTTRPSFERIYGYLQFQLQGKPFRIPVYQSQQLMNTEGYTDYLFFPFTDLTNGKDTYGGGRYIDLRIPKEGDALVVDFNKAYNPYCAYNAGYSCPLVPAENNLDISVQAGVRYPFKRETTSENQVFFVAEQQPEYVGGMEALTKFMAANLDLPKAVKKGTLKGKVFVQFVVETDGSLTRVEVLKGLSEECDKEAVRVVSLMPKWKPGKRNGKVVTSRFVLPIVFDKESGK